MRYAIAITVLALLAGSSSSSSSSSSAGRVPPGVPPAAVFADLDGTWEGTFVGYDQKGEELYRIKVRQAYETVDANTQRVRIRDEMPDGTVIIGTGENKAVRGEDGTLQLGCMVTKSNGEKVSHRGRLVKGPGGDQELVWYTSRSSGKETFREHVKREGDEVYYEINGMGQYRATLILMTGRYRKISDRALPVEEGS